MAAVQLLLVPYDSGRRDWRMGAGPERLITAGLVPRLEALGHAVECAVVVPESDAPLAEIATAFELMRPEYDVDGRVAEAAIRMARSILAAAAR